MGGIAVGGNMIVDYIKIIDSFPKKLSLANIISMERAIGGILPNVLIDLAKIDRSIPLKAIGIVGEDNNGDYIINELEKYNINTELIVKNPKEKTSFTDVMTDNETKERTFFHYRGANALLDTKHFDFSNINADILHIGYALLLDTLDSYDCEYGTKMAKTLKLAQDNGLKTSLDVVSENSDRFRRIVPYSLKYTNYCIINEMEASLTTEIPVRDNEGNIILENIKKACNKIFNMGVRDWVIIHAPEGGFGMINGSDLIYQPSICIPKGYIKGTVGAGDAFCSGILYSIYKKFSLEESLKIAVASAVCCLSSANATDGMKDIEFIKEMCK